MSMGIAEGKWLNQFKKPEESFKECFLKNISEAYPTLNLSASQNISEKFSSR